jgi:hypothetical protein
MSEELKVFFYTDFQKINIIKKTPDIFRKSNKDRVLNISVGPPKTYPVLPIKPSKK